MNVGCAIIIFINGMESELSNVAAFYIFSHKPNHIQTYPSYMNPLDNITFNQLQLSAGK